MLICHFRQHAEVGGYCVGIAINRQPPINIWEIVSLQHNFLWLHIPSLELTPVYHYCRRLTSSIASFHMLLVLGLLVQQCHSAMEFVPFTSLIS
jgi:hypothetical protein